MSLSCASHKVGYEAVERFGDLCRPADFVAAEDVLMVETHNLIFAIMCRASRVKADWIIAATLRTSKLNKAISVRYLRDVRVLKNCHAQFIERLFAAIGEKVDTPASKAGKAYLTKCSERQADERHDVQDRNIKRKVQPGGCYVRLALVAIVATNPE